MNPQTTVEIIRQTLMMAFWLSLPLLVVGFVAGVAVSRLQIVTSMQDPAFAAIPRLAAFLGGLMLALPWMLRHLMDYAAGIFGDLGRYAR